MDSIVVFFGGIQPRNYTVEFYVWIRNAESIVEKFPIPQVNGFLESAPRIPTKESMVDLSVVSIQEDSIEDPCSVESGYPTCGILYRKPLGVP